MYFYNYCTTLFKGPNVTLHGNSILDWIEWITLLRFENIISEFCDCKLIYTCFWSEFLVKVIPNHFSYYGTYFKNDDF